MCTNNWKKYSLGTQLTIVFSIIVIVALGLAATTVLVYNVIISHKAKSQVKAHLLAQSSHNVQNIVNDGANLFDRQLSRSAKFVEINANLMGDTQRSDYPFS